MSLNSSSHQNSSRPSQPDFLYQCFFTTVGTFNLTVYTATNVLLMLPLHLIVLYIGHQQRRPSTSTSHSDFITYHAAVLELLGILGSILTSCGTHARLNEMMAAGKFFFSITFTGQMLFQALTCVERYLAVVHPITYLSLRGERGVRIRNISICCVWLLCFTGISLQYIFVTGHLVIFYVCVIIVILMVVSFLSLSVLCVLIRPGPGEGGGGRQRVDQSKLRAFHTFLAILGVLVLRFAGEILSTVLYSLLQERNTEICGMYLSTVWFIMPSSLVLPVLFLQRAGKLHCCKNNKVSGQGSG